MERDSVDSISLDMELGSSSEQDFSQENPLVVVAPVKTERVCDDDEPLDVYFPVLTLVVSAMVAFSFIAGVVYETHWGSGNTSLSGMFPAEQSFVYKTVSSWPDCEDDRSDFWRIITHPFVHLGIAHLVPNLLTLIAYGFFVEIHCGKVVFGAVFSAAVLAGTLAHSLYWPFRGVVGCSHGVYGLLGASLVVFLSLRRRMPMVQRLVIGGGLSLIFAIEIYTMLFRYTDNVAHEAHVTGLLAGVLVAMSFGPWTKGEQKRSIVQLVAVIVLIGGLSAALVLLHAEGPPSDSYLDPFWSEYPTRTCCAKLIEVQQVSPVSANDYVCRGNNIFEL